MCNKRIKGIVCEHGINDMPDEWIKENEWNYKIYKKWSDMLYRAYSEKLHDKCPTYMNVTVQLEFHWLSYFAKHFKEIDGYDEQKFLNGELELDKDIKSDGQNKEYSIENCMLVSRVENVKQAIKTMDNTYLKNRVGENNPMYGKKLSNERIEQMSKMNSGKNNPMARPVLQYTKDGKFIKRWDYAKQVEEEIGICRQNIANCCRKKLKSAGGFVWRYEDDEFY